MNREPAARVQSPTAPRSLPSPTTADIQMLSRRSHRLAVQDVALSRRKQGFESPRERHINQQLREYCALPNLILGRFWEVCNGVHWRPHSFAGWQAPSCDFTTQVPQQSSRRFHRRSKLRLVRRSARLNEERERQGPPDHESGGREFESLRARQIPTIWNKTANPGVRAGVEVLPLKD